MAQKRQPSSYAQINWDRLGRFALLAVVVGIVVLYVSPLKSWMGAYDESQKRKSQLAQVKAENADLRKREQELNNPAVLEEEARRIGMIKANERAYVVKDRRSS